MSFAVHLCVSRKLAASGREFAIMLKISSSEDQLLQLQVQDLSTLKFSRNFAGDAMQSTITWGTSEVRLSPIHVVTVTKCEYLFPVKAIS